MNNIEKQISKRIAIVDVDDVIVFTTSLWYDRIYNKPEIFSKYIDPNKILLPYDYERNLLYNYSRKTYLFSDWLLRKDLTPEMRIEGEKEIMNIYRRKDFYNSDKLIPTSMLFYFKKLLQYKEMGIERVVFVTRSFPETADSKIEMIRSYYKDLMSSIDIILVDKDEKKSDAIKDYDNIGLVFDDELSNICDYLENSKQIQYAEFLIPRYGYNDENNLENIDIIKHILEIQGTNKINYYDYGIK